MTRSAGSRRAGPDAETRQQQQIFLFVFSLSQLLFAPHSRLVWINEYRLLSFLSSDGLFLFYLITFCI